jgi:hypothetical protein
VFIDLIFSRQKYGELKHKEIGGTPFHPRVRVSRLKTILVPIFYDYAFKNIFTPDLRPNTEAHMPMNDLQNGGRRPERS